MRSGSYDEPGQDPGHAGALDPELPEPAAAGGINLTAALIWAPAVLWLLSLLYDRFTRDL